MPALPNILVTGANGQLGRSLRKISATYPPFAFIFLSREDMPVHHPEMIRHSFEAWHPQYCINCAAYTAVDRAEEEKEKAFIINGNAVGSLAGICREFNIKLIHISTDYVFDGNTTIPYRETDPVNPINVYGASKLMGEELCSQQNPEAIIIRSSWVYSEFGKNFVRTMLRLQHEKNEINVVNDQFGSPTYASDLAEAILKIIAGEKWTPGIFHFSNAGTVSWYEFASEIKQQTHARCKINPVSTQEYPTLAKRPAYSVLNTEKIRQTYHLRMHDWKQSLAACLVELTGK